MYNFVELFVKLYTGNKKDSLIKLSLIFQYIITLQAVPVDQAIQAPMIHAALFHHQVQFE